MSFSEFVYLATGFWLGWWIGEPIIRSIPTIIREIRETKWSKK